jgi:uncharacterized protein YjbI with pentapeptide repeats
MVPGIVSAACEDPPALQVNWANCNKKSATLVNANLRGANLRHTNFMGATLGNVNLQGADLTEANLLSANLSNANLNKAILTKAKHRDLGSAGSNVPRTRDDTERGSVGAAQRKPHHGDASS